ncbi:C40 family peptidase [Paenibacillus sp. MAH-36]|uniref:C40 family peptidase n=1 Tax=Paenibacillus violae TaxID=3077234 RepID=A0ABU3RQ81_9BACL|nr:C40 family peptidase [Paenibacillus sp. PFR10]MDU0206363.1 C40 family peptidase [Paenibacillus sp. PFR10]
MTHVKKNRLSQSLVGIALSLSLFGSASLLLPAPSAQAATVSASKADQIVNTALSYQGKVKYRFGVKDPQHLAFDCSSFTQFVFSKNGISIPWGSSAQTRVGSPVKDKAHLQKGDLVMFSVSTPGHINHVGIYLGNGKFVGNSPSRGVAIYDLNSGYWNNRYITGRHL